MLPLGYALAASTLSMMPKSIHRHRTLALVCRRWAELVHSPALLTDAQLTERDPAALIPRLRSFCTWVSRRAARHVRRLSLQVNLNGVQHESEFLGLLAAATTACSASGQLQDLSLKICHHPSSMPLSWVAALTSLRRLVIDADLSSAVDVCGSFDHLTNLQELELCERTECRFASVMCITPAAHCRDAPADNQPANPLQTQ